MYPASHAERPTKDTGTHEKHASQHRPTTHPPLGVLLHLTSSPVNVSTLGLQDLLPGALLYPRQALLALHSFAFCFYFRFFFRQFLFGVGLLPFNILSCSQHRAWLSFCRLSVNHGPLRASALTPTRWVCSYHGFAVELFDILSPHAISSWDTNMTSEQRKCSPIFVLLRYLFVFTSYFPTSKAFLV